MSRSDDRRSAQGARLRLDAEAQSASDDVPEFLARPAGAPVYHGFPVVPETLTDGWTYGAITEYDDDPTSGDGFVVAPDGTRAGIAWSVGTHPTRRIVPATRERWGVYSMAFPHAVHSVADLVDCFRHVLPELRRLHARATAPWWSPRRWTSFFS
jgi:hypothetical protein